ncbi:hypothetical protein [Roseicyclus sp.]|uniref:hypothetical protein n=1 Tax=Roseicyclus sp. TaxID=1914329 RepID=UPI003F6BA7D3
MAIMVMTQYMRPALLLLLLPLMACSGGALSNPDTGISGVYSAQRPISDHPHHVLMGHVIIAHHDSAVARALVIGHRRDGVHGLRFTAAWQDGRPLRFRRETGTGCSHGHCRDGPIGMILLSEAEFRAAMVSGLRARLTGPSGTIDLHAPASLFIAAAGRAVGV